VIFRPKPVTEHFTFPQDNQPLQDTSVYTSSKPTEEQRDQPESRGKPLIDGAQSLRYFLPDVK
jgi:hypothetical protein